MDFLEIRLAPGVNIEKTTQLNAGGISDAAFIRWKEGLVEKLGGWGRFYPASVNVGIPRALQPWEDLNGNNRLAIGGTNALKVLTGGSLTDITPQETITNTAPNFSTVINTPTVTIVDSNVSNPSTNDFVFIATPVSIGGIVLFGIYPIQTIISSTSYTITAASNATATVNNAGAVPLFTTTNGSSQVQVTLNNHGFSAGQTVTFLISTTFNSVTISGNYLVQSPVTANTFFVTAQQTATGAGSASENGGNVNFTYYVQIGPQPLAAGWGIGTYGTGGYGIGIAPPQGAGTPITATDYSLLNFGENLIANPAGGPLFNWGPESGFINAGIIPNGPIVADGCFLAQPQQIIVAWGASFTGANAPLRLVWCDAGNFNQWTPTSTNFAGGFTIARGSKIVACIQSPNQFVVLTDIGAWSGQYIGQPLVFSIIEIMSGCGLIGRKALGIANTTAYWLSQTQPFQMASGGAPQVMPCPIWDKIFQRIDTNNYAKVRFFANSQFNEIGWYFPSKPSLGGNGENDSYVKFNTVEGEWDYGPMGRSAWIDQSIFGPPIGTTTAGLVYQHETSPDADGVAMNPFILTGDYAMGKGEEFGFIDYAIPDAIYGLNGSPQTATMLYTFFPKNFPGDAPANVPQPQGPFMATAQTPFIEPRVRGRTFALRIESQDLSSFWRLGLVRCRVAPDGRNP